MKMSLQQKTEMKSRKLAILCFFFFIFQSFSADLKSIELYEKHRVATYIGTFNPLHLRHEEIIEGVLDSGLADYVVVLANDLNFHKPEALAFEHRMKMLWERYKEDPRVLVIKNLEDFPFPSVSSVTHFLESKKVHLSGIMGLDSILSFKTRVAAFLMKRSSWIVTYASANEDLKNTRDHIAGSPVDFLEVPVKSVDVRSTQLRKQLNSGNYENLPLSSAIITYIKNQKIYSNPAPKASLKKKLHFCAQQLLYWLEAKL